MTTNPKDQTTQGDVLPELIIAENGGQERLIRALGSVMGYGRIMQLCEEIWREIHPGAEHTTGPCGFFMVACPHPVQDDHGHCEVCCGSGRITKWVRDNLYPAVCTPAIAGGVGVEWLTLENAPLNTIGHLWADGFTVPDMGVVYEYHDGERFASGQCKGYKYTHWQKITPPQAATDEG